MDNESKMKLMKERIVGSYAWQRDIINPLSKDFDCTPEELKEVLFKLFTMSDLEAFHSTYETAQDICLAQKFNADLRLCWFIGTLEVITPEDGEKLKEKLVEEVKSGKPYDEVLKQGQLELFELLKKESEY
ncbi:MAG: DUF1959 family protein [Methanobrevibacter sp.]|jgi:energy-converting hydrogenase A subunit M|nr:DUF1959 family protein [Methanobrevibacter sp.]